MKRRRPSITLTLSLLLLAALLALWIRSYWRADGLVHIQPGRQSGIWSHRGRLLLDSIGDDDVPLWSERDNWHLVSDTPTPAFIDHPAAEARGALGFAWAGVNFVGTAVTTIAIPFWPFALLLSLPSASALARAARRRACRRKQICPDCGYDLRASPDRCPECGTAFAPAPPRSAERAAARSDHSSP